MNNKNIDTAIIGEVSNDMSIELTERTAIAEIADAIAIKLPHIIFIHGLYMNQLSMKWLEHHFKKRGFKTSIFTYPSMQKRTKQHALALIQFINKINTHCAIVAHSLGGLVIRDALSIDPNLPITHIVACGVPFKGSDIARKIQALKIGKIIGTVIQDLIINNEKAWDYPPKLGIISGINKKGLGRILIDGIQDSDGTVLTRETQIEGMSDYIEIPYSHTSMLFHSLTAEHAMFFILHNQFQHVIKHKI